MDVVVVTSTHSMVSHHTNVWKRHLVLLVLINASSVGDIIRILLVKNGNGRLMIRITSLMKLCLTFEIVTRLA